MADLRALQERLASMEAKPAKSPLVAAVGRRKLSPLIVLAAGLKKKEK